MINIETRLILASGSSARCSMLRDAGLDFEIIPADIDESGILESLDHTVFPIKEITQRLAIEKAMAVAKSYPDALVIGSDQTLAFDGKLLSKAKSIEEGKDKLRLLRGQTHRLYSSVCIAQGNEILLTYTDYADLTMHDFDDTFLENYAVHDAQALTSCVGGYKIEGVGAWLFEHVDGDHYTIMGMPLLPLLSFLRTQV